MTVAVLDACVLFQGTLTDFLLNLADHGAFEPVWSAEIHREWMGNLHAKRGIPMAALEHRRAAMERALPGASCKPDPDAFGEAIIHALTDAQRKDVHVVATAVSGDADIIVTHNARDFPDTILGAYGLMVRPPDWFCAGLLANTPERVLAGARAHRISMTRPAYAVDAYLDLITGPRAGLIRTAKLLRAHTGEL